MGSPSVASRSAGAPGPVAGEKIPGQYIVTLRDDAATVRASADKLGRKYGAEVEQVYEHVLGGFAAQMSKSEAEAMSRNPAVESVKQDVVVQAVGTQPSPPWGLDRVDERDLPLDGVYSYPTLGAVRAYIIDTGIRVTHQDFGGRASVGFDARPQDGQNGADCTTSGHGTHVAGTVGGSTYGVAKGATLVAVRVLGCNGSGSASEVIAGVDWVTANAIKPAVANMSLGTPSVYAPIDTAVQNSINSGVTYAVAAGNSNVSACSTSPAAAPQALTVAATGTNDARASFSNYGSCVDLFAPGVGIVSATNAGNTATGSLSGTSMASPHVAGTAALYLSQNPTASPSQVASAINANATMNHVSSAGTGTPNRLDYTGFIPATPATPPEAPVLNVTAPNAPLHLAWTVPANGGSAITGYKVYRGTSPGGELPTPLASLASTVTSYDDSMAANGTTYYYQVAAVNAVAEGTRSTEKSGIPASPYPSPPQGNWVDAFGSQGYVLADWNDAAKTDLSALPAGVTFTLDQGLRDCWTACTTTSDVRALRHPTNPNDRHTGDWWHANEVRAHLTFANAYTGKLRLYAADMTSTARRQTMTVTDADGPETIAITTSYNQGAWATYNITVPAGGGIVSITVTRTGPNDADLQGIFLGDAGPPFTPPPPPPPPPPTSIGQYCAPVAPPSPASYQTAVDNLRKANTGWASADGSVPIALPDGRTLWLYGDTFVGSVSGSGVISTPPVLVENSAALQTGNCFNPLMGGPPGARTALIPRPTAGQGYWPSSAIIDSAGRLQVFLMHVQYNPFTVFGFKVATFSLPDLSLLSISAQLTFTSTTRTYGTTALVDGGFVYVYSSNDQNQRVARAPLGSVTSSSAYQFWNGSSWSSSSSAATALQFNNVPTPVVGINLQAPISGLWVVRHGNGYLGTAKLVNQFSDDVSLFTAPAPQGPWTYVGRAVTTPSGVFSYGAQTAFGLQGMPASPATIFSTNVPGTATTIQQYGPRFVAPNNVPAPLP